MNVLAVWLGKLTLLALRLLGRRGNALPGLVVEKVFPGFLARRWPRCPRAWSWSPAPTARPPPPRWSPPSSAERYRVLTNDTGSNFVRGAITATVEHAVLAGRLPYDVAVFELDEAWAVRFVELRRAASARCCSTSCATSSTGSARSTRPPRLLGKVAAADHRRRRAQPRRRAARRARRRHDAPRSATTASRRSCASCSRTTRSSTAGRSRCPSCRPRAELRALPPAPAPRSRLRIGGVEHDVDAARRRPAQRAERRGAAALALTFGLDADDRRRRPARRCRPAFGRGQSFTVDGRRVVLQLVKNPAGFRQTLRTLDGAAAGDAIVIAINDDYADGRDVSWLWDVDFADAARPIRPADRPPGPGRPTWRCGCATTTSHVDEIEPDLEKAVRPAVAARRGRARHVRRVQHLHRDVGAARRSCCGSRQPSEHAGMNPLAIVHLYPARDEHLRRHRQRAGAAPAAAVARAAGARSCRSASATRCPTDADILLGGGGQDAAQGEIGARLRRARRRSCARWPTTAW